MRRSQRGHRLQVRKVTLRLFGWNMCICAQCLYDLTTSENSGGLGKVWEPLM